MSSPPLNTISLTEQIKGLMSSGMSLGEICSRLSMTIEAAQYLLDGPKVIPPSDQDEECAKILQTNKVKVLKELLAIGLDGSIDSVSARVKALTEFLNYDKGLKDEKLKVTDEFEDRVKKLREVMEKHYSAPASSGPASSKSKSNGTIVLSNNATLSNHVLASNSSSN